jgi:hypothetical protein
LKFLNYSAEKMFTDTKMISNDSCLFKKAIASDWIIGRDEMPDVISTVTTGLIPFMMLYCGKYRKLQIRLRFIMDYIRAIPDLINYIIYRNLI